MDSDGAGTAGGIDPAVQEYLDQVPDAARAPLEELRAAVREGAPDAEEGISYNMPAFRVDGQMLVYCAAFKRHCSLFALSATVLERYKADVEPYVQSKGTLRFEVGEPIPTQLVTRLVRARRRELDGA